jgi:hypothetical protein
MNACHTSLTLSEKLAVFRACFAGLAHVYGTRDLRTQRISQVKHPVTDRVIVDHLCGRHHLGTYLLNGARTRAVVIDFDTADLMPAIEFQQGGPALRPAHECGTQQVQGASRVAVLR